MKIGVFDSGLGGLAILKAFRKDLPQYDYLYLGDNLHFPYGNRSQEQIINWTRKAVLFFIRNNCRLIIFACNTATAVALPILQKEFLDQAKILGIVRPTSEFLSSSSFTRVGIVGTTNTVKSNIFNYDLRKINSNKRITLYQQDCPGLVEEIEKGPTGWQNLEKLLTQHLSWLKREKIEALVLGCTHYNLVTTQIRAVFPETKIVTQGELAAQKLNEYLKKQSKITRELSKGQSLKLFFTKENPNYEELANFFLENNSPIKPEFIKINFSG